MTSKKGPAARDDNAMQQTIQSMVDNPLEQTTLYAAWINRSCLLARDLPVAFMELSACPLAVRCPVYGSLILVSVSLCL
ncbi:hypothetical protein GOP47_0030637 [Adiantum capillus-veneris]|nr:hypothetical protein GOP47_0030637 [Adiantum capillus-veneris]